LGDLAEVLRSIEDALAAIMGLPPEEVVLGLVGVREASAGYACALPSREAERALDAWSGAIQNSDFSSLPAAAIEPSRKILAFVRRKNCKAEFRKGTSRTPLAQMTPDTVIAVSKELDVKKRTATVPPEELDLRQRAGALVEQLVEDGTPIGLPAVVVAEFLCIVPEDQQRAMLEILAR
jgi:hypothetical protein